MRFLVVLHEKSEEQIFHIILDCKLYICIKNKKYKNVCKKMSIYNKKSIPYNEIKDENFFQTPRE